MTDGRELKLRREMRDLGGRLVNTCTYTEVHGEMFSFGNWKIKKKYELKLMVTEWRGKRRVQQAKGQTGTYRWVGDAAQIHT